MSHAVFTPQNTLREIALAQPASIRVFERHQLDYCCGGRRPLAHACEEKFLDAALLLAEIESANAQPDAPADFANATPGQLIRHIVATHHAYVLAEIPRIQALATKVAAKHGPAHPEYVVLERGFRLLAEDLTHHLAKEEQILFPYVLALENYRTQGGEPPHACFASVESPVGAMIHEHENAGALLTQLRRATNDYTPPPEACPTLVGLLHSVQDFERDLHQHIHMENNLLFPLAVALEKETLAA